MRLVIETGYVPGLIGRMAALSVINMAASHGFGAAFERRVARDVAEFTERLESADLEVWRAMDGGRIAGTIAMDGEDLGDGRMHLRWFMLDPAYHGRGLGRALIGRALAFADGRGFGEVD